MVSICFRKIFECAFSVLIKYASNTVVIKIKTFLLI